MYETVESLRLKGFIELVLVKYTKVTDIRREVLSVESVPDDAIPAILGNPDNWGRSEVIFNSLERYTYQTTDKGDAYVLAHSQTVGDDPQQYRLVFIDKPEIG